MAEETIHANEGAMAGAAQAFDGSSMRMQEARSTLQAPVDELSEAWQGLGAEQYETLKGIVLAHCCRMAETASLEASNIRAAASAYVEADAAAATLVGQTGR